MMGHQMAIRLLRRDGWSVLLLLAVPFLLLVPFWARQDVFAFPRSELGTDFLVKQWPNGVFVKQGVYLGAGEHTVELVYRPQSWYWGLAGTACGVVVAVCCIVLPLGGKRIRAVDKEGTASG